MHINDIKFSSIVWISRNLSSELIKCSLFRSWPVDIIRCFWRLKFFLSWFLNILQNLFHFFLFHFKLYSYRRSWTLFSLLTLSAMYEKVLFTYLLSALLATRSEGLYNSSLRSYFDFLTRVVLSTAFVMCNECIVKEFSLTELTLFTLLLYWFSVSGLGSLLSEWTHMLSLKRFWFIHWVFLNSLSKNSFLASYHVMFEGIR